MPVVSVVFMLLAGRNSMGKVSLKVADVIVHVYFWKQTGGLDTQDIIN
mgnify:CR=1 FL=1